MKSTKVNYLMNPLSYYVNSESIKKRMISAVKTDVTSPGNPFRWYMVEAIGSMLRDRHLNLKLEVRQRLTSHLKNLVWNPENLVYAIYYAGFAAESRENWANGKYHFYEVLRDIRATPKAVRGIAISKVEAGCLRAEDKYADGSPSTNYRIDLNEGWFWRVVHRVLVTKGCEAAIYIHRDTESFCIRFEKDGMALAERCFVIFGDDGEVVIDGQEVTSWIEGIT